MPAEAGRGARLTVYYRRDDFSRRKLSNQPIFDGSVSVRSPNGCFTATSVVEALPVKTVQSATLDALCLDALPLPVLLCRALDGWVFIATPDRKAWRGLCMTFLNRDVATRFNENTAWQSREVLELAGLVFGTYDCEDLLGRCPMFDVRCLAASDGRSPTGVAIRYCVIRDWSRPNPEPRPRSRR